MTDGRSSVDRARAIAARRQLEAEFPVGSRHAVRAGLGWIEFVTTAAGSAWAVGEHERRKVQTLLAGDVLEVTELILPERVGSEMEWLHRAFVYFKFVTGPAGAVDRGQDPLIFSAIETRYFLAPAAATTPPPAATTGPLPLLVTGLSLLGSHSVMFQGERTYVAVLAGDGNVVQLALLDSEPELSRLDDLRGRRLRLTLELEEPEPEENP